VFMKEDLVPIIGDENMIQEMPEEFKNLMAKIGWKSMLSNEVDIL